jgi:TetR/AcrR family fatty acid metabolism transcriptional regulator
MNGRTDKRQSIMQAAEKLFTSRRFHEITMDDVAASAGLAKGTLYRYFQDKEDLFFQTSTGGFDELCEIITRTVPTKAPFAQQLLRACRQISGFFQRRRQLLRMMQAEDGRLFHCRGAMRQRWLDRRRKLLSAIKEILAKGVSEGQVRRDISTEVLAHVLLGLMRMRAHELADMPERMRRHEVIIDLFRHGVSAAGGSKGLQSGDRA